MKKFLFLFLACLFVVSPSFAKPVTLLEVQSELGKRGIEPVKIAYLRGFPVASGEIEGQPFLAILRNCELGKEPCGSIRFEACGAPSEHTRSELLEIVNAYNAGFYTGSAFVEPMDGNRTLACIRLQLEFRDENVLGIDEVFAWQQALEDFLDFYDERAGTMSRTNIELSGQ